MISVIKTTTRLLLRNKGFLVFLLLTPLISTLILSLKLEFDAFKGTDGSEILTIESMDERAVYVCDTYSFAVKVYDSAGTELSEYMLGKLAENDMFSVARLDARDIPDEDVSSQIEKDGFFDRAGVILRLKSGFDDAVLGGDLSDGLELIISSDDDREEIFETEINDLLSKIHRAGTVSGGDPAKTTELLDSIEEKLPVMNVTEIVPEDELKLTSAQDNNSMKIGYAFAIITLGYMFAGAFTAHTVIKEEHNKVFTRLMLSGKSPAVYYSAKFIVMAIMCLLQTCVLGVCLLFVKGLDIGMPLPEFLAVVFLLGLIIAAISMLTGIIFNDIMSTNYAAFTMWALSSILAGLYFPIEGSSDIIVKLSYLTPQKWFLDISKKFIAGLSGTCPTLLGVTAAYLIVIISVGSVCLKIKKQEP